MDTADQSRCGCSKPTMLKRRLRAAACRSNATGKDDVGLDRAGDGGFKQQFEYACRCAARAVAGGSGLGSRRQRLPAAPGRRDGSDAMTSARLASVIWSQSPISTSVLPQPWQYLPARSMRQMLMHELATERGGIIMASLVWMPPSGGGRFQRLARELDHRRHLRLAGFDVNSHRVTLESTILR